MCLAVVGPQRIRLERDIAWHALGAHRGNRNAKRGHHKRGTYFRWLFYAAGPVEAAVTNKALKVEVSEEQSRFVGYGNFDAAIDALELALRPGPYICGDQFTAADVYVGSQIGYGMMFGSIEKRPLFEDYFGRLQARPAAKRAAALDDALMAPAA